MQKEILGYKAISSLLEAFVCAGANAFENKADSYDKLILQLIPEDVLLPAENLYETLLNATCYIASLTDSKALLLAEKVGSK